MPGLADIPGNQVIRISVPVMAAAGTDAESAATHVAVYNYTAVSAKWVPTAAVTANGTNFSTVSVINRGAAGVGTTSIASRSYAATNSVAFVPEAMTMSATAANLLITAGDVLTVQSVHSASGVVVPAGHVELTVTIR